MRRESKHAGQKRRAGKRKRKRQTGDARAKRQPLPRNRGQERFTRPLPRSATYLGEVDQRKRAAVKVAEVGKEALNVVQVLCRRLVLARELGQLVKGLDVVEVLNVRGALEVHVDLVLRVEVQKAAVVLLAAKLDKVWTATASSFE